MTQWWGRRSTGARIGTVLLVLLVGGNLVVSALGEALWRVPGGPRSSSLATGADGLRAFADLLRVDGRTVERRREAVRDDPAPPAGATLVLAEPDVVLSEDLDAAERFVTGGGRLLVIGAGGLPYVRRLVRSDIGWVDQDGGRWAAGSLRRTVRDGSGRVVALAEPSLLQNGRLAEGGNAALGLELVGASRLVVFGEHDRLAGGGVLPDRWVRALVAALVAVLVFLWSAGVRFGPPELPGRELPPPRRHFVDALAVSVERASAPAEVLRPLQRRARARLAHRLGLDAAASREQVEAAARRAGLDPDLDALFLPPESRADVVRLGRAAAHQEGTS